MALVATISEAVPAERRRSPRHGLSLGVEASGTDEPAAAAVVHDLSQTGFLLETAAAVGTGELLQLRLPEAGLVSARVIWSCGRHFGCEFQNSLSAAALSAAVLKARPAPDSEDLPPGLRLGSVCAPESTDSQTTTGSKARNLSLLLGLSFALWIGLVMAVLYAYQ